MHGAYCEENMLKLVQGVVNFHQNVLPGLSEQFAQRALGQSPDALMIVCSDSRVAPNLFASTNPGDLFVVRNPGNLIPLAHPDEENPHWESEAAAIEIAVDTLKVKDIIVCGHSRCAGMAAILNEEEATPNLRQWTRHGREAKRQLDEGKKFDNSLSLQDQLSQLNVVVQLENLKTYPQVKKRFEKGDIRLHGWWFDITSGNVYNFEPEEEKFVVIDEEEGARIIQRLKS